MSTAEASERTVGMDRAARIVSDLGSPPVVGTAYFLVLAIALGPRDLGMTAAAWGLMLCLPSLILLGAVKRGRVSDSDMTLIAERKRFLPLALPFGVVTLAGAVLFRAPSALETSIAGMVLWVAAGSVITQFWKVSMHVSGAAAGFWLSLLFFGPPALAVVWVPVVIGWSRLRLHRHDAWQVAGGALLGTVSVLAAFAALH